MKKKRLTKSEKATLAKINEQQNRVLLRLKSRTQMLIKSSQDTLQKIDAKGIDTHYSSNSDVLRYAQEVWSASLRLAELKALCDDLEYSYGKK